MNWMTSAKNRMSGANKKNQRKKFKQNSSFPKPMVLNTTKPMNVIRPARPKKSDTGISRDCEYLLLQQHVSQIM